MRDHTVLKKHLSGLRSSGKVYFALCAGVFLLMTVLNFLTPKCVDDYSYMFSLVDNHRISSLADIFASLRVHAIAMNGRLAAHFFVYLFDFLPKPVFNIVNALFFLALIVLISRFSGRAEGKTKRDPLVFALVFCAVWCFEYDFGQVNLWLTGSCNYLWALVFSLLYVLPFYDLYSGNSKNSGISGPFSTARSGRGIVFLLFSLLAGAYNEVASSSMIFTAALFIFLMILDGRRPPLFFFISLILSGSGFLSMFLAPAQSAKSGLTQPFTDRLLLALKMYGGYLPLIILWIFLFVLSVRQRKKEQNKNIYACCPAAVSAVFMAGSLCANFILVFAGSYAGRCAAPSLVWLLTALVVLLPELSRSRDHRLFKAVPAVLLLLILPFTVYYGVMGCYDVYRTGQDMRQNLAAVEEARNSGASNVELPLVIPATKYSAIYNLKYLDTETPDTWPNESIAMYYGIPSVTGVP